MAQQVKDSVSLPVVQVTTVARVRSLAQELPHTMGTAKKINYLLHTVVDKFGQGSGGWAKWVKGSKK